MNKCFTLILLSSHGNRAKFLQSFKESSEIYEIHYSLTTTTKKKKNSNYNIFF